MNSPARQRGVGETLATRPKGPAHFICAHVYAHRNACKVQAVPSLRPVDLGASRRAARNSAKLFDRPSRSYAISAKGRTSQSIGARIFCKWARNFLTFVSAGSFRRKPSNAQRMCRHRT